MPNIYSISDTTKHKTERWTSRVLRVGVWMSAGLMIVGLFITLISPSSIVPILKNPTLGTLAERMMSLVYDPITLMFAGLVILMFTPVLRVIVAVYGFAMERDWRFVIVSSIVLLLLAGEIIYSIFWKG
jgi:uncharacterized membrane protein